mgnify:CR=1 FL=1
MPFTLTMPKLSPTMEEGTIVKWKTKEGDLVNADDVLFEVATDKATVEHVALDDGYLRKVIVSDGQEARVGQAIAIFSETKDEDISSYQPEGVVQEQEAPEETETKPSERETTKSSASPTASGPAMSQPAFTPEPELGGYEYPFPTTQCENGSKASPYAKKLAKESNLDLSTVKGTGPSGRIVARDLEKAQSGGLVSFGSRKCPIQVPGSFEEIPLSPMRKVIAQRLQNSKTWIPHFYVTQEIDALGLISLREQLKVGGVKVTFNDLMVRASALALRQHPEINSGFNSVSQSIIRFKTVDISIAVSVPDGLITPIVRHADYKNVGQISSEVKSLVQRAKQSSLSREEYVGGSFTLSNLGMFGITEFKGIIKARPDG